MPLIATSTEHAGVARISLREVVPSPDEERQIAAAMECASATMDTKAGWPAPAE
jgi:hypothetical protein